MADGAFCFLGLLIRLEGFCNCGLYDLSGERNRLTRVPALEGSGHSLCELEFGFLRGAAGQGVESILEPLIEPGLALSSRLGGNGAPLLLRLAFLLLVLALVEKILDLGEISLDLPRLQLVLSHHHLFPRGLQIVGRLVDTPL